jgi:hypothetical protein
LGNQTKHTHILLHASSSSQATGGGAASLQQDADIAVHLPNDLVLDILSMIPAKSLIQFRCVSKGWHALVSDAIVAMGGPILPVSLASARASLSGFSAAIQHSDERPQTREILYTDQVGAYQAPHTLVGYWAWPIFTFFFVFPISVFSFVFFRFSFLFPFVFCLYLFLFKTEKFKFENSLNSKNVQI